VAISVVDALFSNTRLFVVVYSWLSSLTYQESALHIMSSKWGIVARVACILSIGTLVLERKTEEQWICGRHANDAADEIFSNTVHRLNNITTQTRLAGNHNITQQRVLQTQTLGLVEPGRPGSKCGTESSVATIYSSVMLKHRTICLKTSKATNLG